MTKQHFEAIARAFAETMPNDETAYIQWAADVVRIADVCETFNPRFDRLRFLFACTDPRNMRGLVADTALRSA